MVIRGGAFQAADKGKRSPQRSSRKPFVCEGEMGFSAANPFVCIGLGVDGWGGAAKWLLGAQKTHEEAT